jgi:quercetin dioxygenase-like cupin family protein
MKRFSLKDTPASPVSHDPSLEKRVLFGEGTVNGLKHLSHIVLKAGSRAVEHAHAGNSEVFYVIRGTVTFKVNGNEETLEAGECMVVEPGEKHSIEEVSDGAEMLYLMNEPEGP